MDRAAFAQKYRIAPGYQTASNAWFEKICTVPARFNRLIFYDGMLFHGADLVTPAGLTDDPANGRLTLNGFFTCSRHAAK